MAAWGGGGQGEKSRRGQTKLALPAPFTDSNPEITEVSHLNDSIGLLLNRKLSAMVVLLPALSLVRALFPKLPQCSVVLPHISLAVAPREAHILESSTGKEGERD